MSTNQRPKERLTRTEVGRFVADIVRGPEAPGYGARSVHNWMRREGLPFVKWGRELIFYRDQVENWARQRLARNGTAVK